jgi:hypothetical protein
MSVAQEVRIEEHQIGIKDHEAGEIEHILHGVIGMEGHSVLRALHVDAERIVVARHVQRPDVQHHHAGDHEGQQIMQAEEAVQRCVVDAETTPQPAHDGGA